MINVQPKKHARNQEEKKNIIIIIKREIHFVLIFFSSTYYHTVSVIIISFQSQLWNYRSFNNILSAYTLDINMQMYKTSTQREERATRNPSTDQYHVERK
jgi:hypothetical protein